MQYENKTDKKVIITMYHIRKAGFCCDTGGPARIKKIMERYGFDWNKFMNGDITVYDLKKINNPISKRIVEAALGKE